MRVSYALTTDRTDGRRGNCTVDLMDACERRRGEERAARRRADNMFEEVRQKR